MTLSANDYFEILKSELLLALGCTEPIAIALCAAKARSVLGVIPDSTEIYCSANVIKNAHSVIVPNSDGAKGIPFAAALGICGGTPERGLEVLESVRAEHIASAQKMVDLEKISVKLANDVDNLYIRCIVEKDGETAEAVISGKHNRFTSIIKNGKTLLSIEQEQEISSDHHVHQLKSQLNVEEIFNFVKTFECAQEPAICTLIDSQIKNNSAIAEEGLNGDWGQQVGKTLLAFSGDTPQDEIAAFAAAGSDARMSGCSMPVVINSGSGNQGMTVSNPLIKMAEQLKSPKTKLYQALILSNLIAIHIKYYIGSLSAYCGAVSAASAAAGGMAYLKDLPLEKIEKAIINTLAVSSGIICDGAKASCAAKIAVSVKNAQLGVNMASKGLVFQAGDGILGDSIELTIQNVGRLAKNGMTSTDQEILDIILDV